MKESVIPVNPVNPVNPYAPVTYSEMLENAKRAKSDQRDSFEWFLLSATNSGAFQLGRVIDCRENVAGMTLIFMCMALIKFNQQQQQKQPERGLVEELKKHLDALKVMRTSTNVPLCIIPEGEGVMFPGEGMSLRFLNALIILESLLLSKLVNIGNTLLSENWGMYSSLDLMISLELPALMGVLNDAEKRAFADILSDSTGYGNSERKMAADLIRSTVTNKVPQRVKEEQEDSKSGMMFLGFIFLVFYTWTVIKFIK